MYVREKDKRYAQGGKNTKGKREKRRCHGLIKRFLVLPSLVVFILDFFVELPQLWTFNFSMSSKEKSVATCENSVSKVLLCELAGKEGSEPPKTSRNLQDHLQDHRQDFSEHLDQVAQVYSEISRLDKVRTKMLLFCIKFLCQFYFPTR